MRSIALRVTTVLLLAFGLAAAVQSAERVGRKPPPQSFIWVGHPERGFSEEELHHIAENYALLVFERIHANSDIPTRHADAKRLRALSPDIKIFPYFSMSYRYRRDRFGTDTFRQEWLLRDEKTQEVISLTRERRLKSGEVRQLVPGDFIDLSQEAYRRWALRIIDEWLASAPYDGVAFDSAVPTPQERAARRPQLRDATLSREKITAWNDGLLRMLADSRNLGGKRREVIFNGIAEVRTVNRNLDLFEYADTALNEDFCIAARPGKGRHILPSEMLADDIALMVATGAKHKRILQKTNYRSDAIVKALPRGLEQAARFCYAVFLMGYVPGMHYYKFGNSYNVQDGELTLNAREIELPLGTPRGPHATVDGVWIRRFDNGVVYVNPDSRSARTVSVDASLMLMNGNENRGLIRPGTAIEIPPQEAMFLVNSAALEPKAAPGARPPRLLKPEPALSN